MARGVLYCRISKADDTTGVDRQEAIGRGEADRRGDETAEVLKDNDLSGSGKDYRPDFERLIELIDGRQIGWVWAYDVDRYNRGFAEYVRFYQACQRTHMLVLWSSSGRADFATGDGVFELNLRFVFAQEELRKIHKRSRDHQRELAERGRDGGGGRPFGYEADRRTIRESEAQLVKQAARRTLEGEPLYAICSDWNNRGIPTVRGTRNGWATPTLRQMLLSARISGRREVLSEIVDDVTGRRKRTLPGRITAKGNWPGIVFEDDSDRLRALLAAPNRGHAKGDRHSLLTADLLRCGRCGDKLYAARCRGVPGYACLHQPGRLSGCGRLRAQGGPLEREVSRRVLMAVDQGMLGRAMAAHGRDPDLADRVAADEARLDELAREREEGMRSESEYRAARGVLLPRLEQNRKALEGQRARAGLEDVDVDHLGESWPSMLPHRRRAVISMLVNVVEVLPAIVLRGNQFNPDRVLVHWYDCTCQRCAEGWSRPALTMVQSARQARGPRLRDQGRAAKIERLLDVLAAAGSTGLLPGQAMAQAELTHATFAHIVRVMIAEGRIQRRGTKGRVWITATELAGHSTGDRIAS